VSQNHTAEFICSKLYGSISAQLTLAILYDSKAELEFLKNLWGLGTEQE
jgi:hypothetical protein